MRSITCASLIFCVLVGSFGVVSGVSEAETGRDDDLVSGLVVGGADTEITEVPWQAALLNSHLDENDDSGFVDQFCGATVVSEEWLVTAAHCVEFMSDQEGTFDVAGESFGTVTITSHPSGRYRPDARGRDGRDGIRRGRRVSSLPQAAARWERRRDQHRPLAVRPPPVAP